MGVDIIYYGNHKLPLSGKSFSERVSMISDRLKILYLSNTKQLYEVIKQFHDNTLEPDAMESPWVCVSDENDKYYTDLQYISFRGPLGITLSFADDKIDFEIETYSWLQWFCMLPTDNIDSRKEWRTFFWCVIRHFGGDKAIYLPLGDGGKGERFVDIFDDTVTPFEQLETELIAEYGIMKEKMPFTDDFVDNNAIRYYIDDFEDIKGNGDYIFNFIQTLFNVPDKHTCFLFFKSIGVASDFSIDLLFIEYNNEKYLLKSTRGHAITYDQNQKYCVELPKIFALLIIQLAQLAIDKINYAYDKDNHYGYLDGETYFFYERKKNIFENIYEPKLQNAYITFVSIIYKIMDIIMNNQQLDFNGELSQEIATLITVFEHIDKQGNT